MKLLMCTKTKMGLGDLVRKDLPLFITVGQTKRRSINKVARACYLEFHRYWGREWKMNSAFVDTFQSPICNLESVVCMIISI
jgi:hypothetical protein